MSNNFKKEPHSFVNGKWMPWSFCNSCGLVRLKNERTNLAIKLGCNYKESQEYIKMDKQVRKNY